MGTFNANILPTTTGLDLGSSAQRWDVFAQTLDALKINGIQNANSYAGSDIGAKVNAAIASLGTNVTIYIPAGAYSFSTAIVLADGITLQGAGPGATVLTYTGSGVGIDYNYKTRVQVRDLSLVTTTASTAIKVRGVNVSLDNVRVSGASAGKMVWITGDGSSLQSLWVNLSNVKIGDYDFTGIGLQIDHAIDVGIQWCPIYSATNGTTATNFLVDTGTSGLNVQTCTTGFGRNGLLVQNSTPGAGAYNLSPIYLFFDQFFADTTTGGDAIKFDSTLSTSIVNAVFTNSWAAAAGVNNAAAVVTTTANGIHISGGDVISFQGTIRVNALNGVLLDNANAKRITIHDSIVTANNQTNNADAHGVYVNAGVINSAILNSLIGNIVDSGGHQKFAIKISAVLADQLRIEGNDLGGNDTGSLSIANTGNTWIWGNLPSSSAISNVVWGSITMGASSSLNMNSNAISGVTSLGLSGQITSTQATGSAPLVIASTTPVANLTCVPTTYNSSGTQQAGTHIAFGNGVLVSGTPSVLTVTLSGSAVFTSNTSYVVTASNGTTATNSLKVTYASGSSFTITGPNTVTDAVTWMAVGN